MWPYHQDDQQNNETHEKKLVRQRKRFNAGPKLAVKKGKYKLATIGTVRKEISNLIGYKKHFFISEIYFDNLMKIIANSKPKIKPINKFQKVFRDLSILISEEVTMQQITNPARKSIWTAPWLSISRFGVAWQALALRVSGIGKSPVIVVKGRHLAISKQRRMASARWSHWLAI